VFYEKRTFDLGQSMPPNENDAEKLAGLRRDPDPKKSQQETMEDLRRDPDPKKSDAENR
jgi:hypothetical protein